MRYTVNSLDDLPQRESSHDTAEADETAFRAAIDACKLFVIQREDRNDYGTDIQIEARYGIAMTNIRAHVQLKGTESAANVNGSVSVSVARTNLNYLLAQANSVYICHHLPSERLLVRYADDVYREYEHRETEWYCQETVTVNFTQLFDEKFQHGFNARLLASGKLSRDRRLQWIATPPEQIPALVQQTAAIIEVPADPVQARTILTELYKAGNDAIISNSFTLFAAVLNSLPGAMDLAYMAEINLGINGSSFDEARVTQGIQVLQEAVERGEVCPGSLLYCMGNGWLALREYVKARDAYRAALTHLGSPELAGVAAMCSKNLGSVLEKLGEMDEARALYDQALELDPDLSEAHFALALWHRRRGEDPFLSLTHLDRVIRQRDSAVAMSAVQGWRIDLLFNIGDSDGAYREINALLSEANQLDWVWPWCARQVAYFGKMSIEAVRKALPFWRAYIREYPEDGRAEREILLCAWHMRAVGEPTEMDFNEFKLAMVRLIESGDPDPAYLWDRLGHWAQYDGDWLEAERAYRKAYGLEPERYGYCFGTALNFLNQHSEALPILLRQAEEHQSDAMSWFQVAVAREGVGNTEGSIAAYHRALELDADYDLAWFNLAGMYWNSRDIVRARDIWGKAVKLFPNHELTKKLRRDLPFLFKENNDKPNQ